MANFFGRLRQTVKPFETLCVGVMCKLAYTL